MKIMLWKNLSMDFKLSRTKKKLIFVFHFHKHFEVPLCDRHAGLESISVAGAESSSPEHLEPGNSGACILPLPSWVSSTFSMCTALPSVALCGALTEKNSTCWLYLFICFLFIWEREKEIDIHKYTGRERGREGERKREWESERETLSFACFLLKC